MNVLNVEQWLALMQSQNFKVFYEDPEKPYNLNIVGVRDLSAVPNTFGDCICVFYQSRGDWFTLAWPATTMPGTPYLFKPINFKGAAILAPGQYKGAYKIGLHKGSYPALVQARPLQVFRDNDLDGFPEEKEEYIETGLFGINIHKASTYSRIVGVSSAGCQVFQSPQHFADFMELCDLSRQYWGNSFTYTLVEL